MRERKREREIIRSFVRSRERERPADLLYALVKASSSIIKKDFVVALLLGRKETVTDFPI